MTKHYALFQCNEHKEHASMRLVGVFTRARLSRVIAERVNHKEFEFNNDQKPKANDVAQFPYVADLNNALTYGYIEELDINEEIR